MANRTPHRPSGRVDVNAAARAVQAINLRKLGATYDQIAQQCGFSDRSSAYNAVKRELRRALTVPASDLRLLEAERLDDLWRAYIPKALRGDEKSGRLCLQIMERRASLLGLDAPKAEHDKAGAASVIIREYPPAWTALLGLGTPAGAAAGGAHAGAQMAPAEAPAMASAEEAEAVMLS